MLLTILLSLISISFSQPANQTLLAARLECIELLTVRSTSYPQLLLAYEQCVSDDVTHTVRDVGDFGPGKSLALEYDEIVNIFPLIGIPSPVLLRPVYDRNTITWLSADTVRVDYIINITVSYNASTGGYNYVMQGFRYSTYYIFANSTTDRVSLIYDIQDPAAIALFSQDSNTIDPAIICGAFIFPACTNYLADTGYSSIADCAAFIASVQAPSDCPFQGRSNTAACRTTHAWASFIRPDIHCSHTSRDNPVCSDNCYPACSNCSAYADCVATFPTLSDPGYACQCKNGYKDVTREREGTSDSLASGNGKVCSPQSCKMNCARYQTCDNGVCKCKKTFTWQPNATRVNDQCKCIDGQVKNGLCVPTGRCTMKSHCTIQQSQTVSCSDYGFNPLTEWKHCLCNYGYVGGWEYPCTCPTGKRQVHSGKLGEGRVCLAAGECVRRADCDRREECVLRVNSTIGDCV